MNVFVVTLTYFSFDRVLVRRSVVFVTAAVIVNVLFQTFCGNIVASRICKRVHLFYVLLSLALYKIVIYSD